MGLLPFDIAEQILSANVFGDGETKPRDMIDETLTVEAGKTISRGDLIVTGFNGTVKPCDQAVQVVAQHGKPCLGMSPKHAVTVALDNERVLAMFGRQSRLYAQVFRVRDGVVFSRGDMLLVANDWSPNGFAACRAGANQGVIAYRGASNRCYGVAVSVSDLAVSAGAASVLHSSGAVQWDAIEINHADNRAVVVIRSSDGSLCPIVVQASETSLTRLQHRAIRNSYGYICVDRLADDKFVIAARDSTEDKAYVVVGTFTGSSISLGPPLYCASEYVYVVRAISSDKALIGLSNRARNTTMFRVLTITGNSVSAGAPQPLESLIPGASMSNSRAVVWDTSTLLIAATAVWSGYGGSTVNLLKVQIDLSETIAYSNLGQLINTPFDGMTLARVGGVPVFGYANKALVVKPVWRPEGYALQEGSEGERIKVKRFASTL